MWSIEGAVDEDMVFVFEDVLLRAGLAAEQTGALPQGFGS